MMLARRVSEGRAWPLANACGLKPTARSGRSATTFDANVRGMTPAGSKPVAGGERSDTSGNTAPRQMRPRGGNAVKHFVSGRARALRCFGNDEGPEGLRPAANTSSNAGNKSFTALPCGLCGVLPGGGAALTSGYSLKSLRTSILLLSDFWAGTALRCTPQSGATTKPGVAKRTPGGGTEDRGTPAGFNKRLGTIRGAQTAA
ncbi:hypothetical protein TBK1r_20220 [Stieleria magnilauensis]|uniref:Uncharacterized protein n=1 Tax=Stieleria magnilauensis TaxID=2527963 RepID=A0ABX5XN28_9BACT|nr:hypothetical protein TBK1r_20220 [Planctomycetes bacterium TBK1r]